MEQSSIYLVTPVASKALVDTYIGETTPCFGIDAGVLLCKDKENCFGCMGDFDSLENKEILALLSNVTVLNCEKDVTDTKASIDYLLSQGWRHLIVLGGFMGKRIDHLYANLLLAYHYPITWIDEYSKVECVQGSYVLTQEDYQYFSIFTIDGCDVTIQDAKYLLQHYHLTNDDPLCVSNTWINSKSAKITIENGKAIIMKTKEKLL